VSAAAFVHVIESGRRKVIATSAEQSKFAQPCPNLVHETPAARALSQLRVHMPNGITLRLECSGHHASLVSAMIEAPGRCARTSAI
jgi:transposase